MARTTQTNRLLEYLESYGSITQLQALEDLGVMRLASRISDLKRMGYPIRVEHVIKHNRFGDRVSIAQYSLEAVG